MNRASKALISLRLAAAAAFVVAAFAPPAHADMPHFSMTGTATAKRESDPPKPATIFLAFDLTPVRDSSCGDELRGRCKVTISNELYQSSLAVGDDTTNIESGRGILKIKGTKLRLHLKMRTEDNKKVSIRAEADMNVGDVSAIGRAKLDGSRVRLSFPPQSID